MNNTTPIQPSELRVGNVLMYTGSDEGPMRCKIDAMDIFFCENRNEEFNGVHERIPITPELLVEIGFEHNRAGIFGNNYTLNGVSIQLKGNGIYMFVPHARCEVQYLHQLQNLYFALTGEELTINTKEQ